MANQSNEQTTQQSDQVKQGKQDARYTQSKQGRQNARYTQSKQAETAYATTNKAASKTLGKSKRKWPKRLAITLTSILLLCGIGFGAYVSDYYHAEIPATELSTEAIPVTETDTTITVGTPTDKGLIFYPGGKVDPAAYVPLMQELAKEGFYCVIAKMPFNLAVFNINAADAIIEESQVDHWWIAGHSLGGAMASQYAADNPETFEGIALLGAYAASNISKTDLTTLVIYGSNDLVLNRDNLESNQENLPTNTQTVVIEGGNHAWFGNYGKQAGDGEATITAQDQQKQTAQLISEA